MSGRRGGKAILVLLLLLLLPAAFGLLLMWRGHAGGTAVLSSKPGLLYSWVDGTHFERFRGLIHPRGKPEVRVDQGRLLVNGAPVSYPDGEDLAVVSRSGQLTYIRVPEKCFERAAPRGGVSFAGIELPTFRKHDGVPIALQRKCLQNNKLWARIVRAARGGRRASPRPQ